ncbi:hypothetical protein B0H16DRAFT_1802266 [Mycena metata]|uniref:Chromo domain-containing protein n=1 Tax=Mycena metata TaxID=1033252 RepID=A0AAD7KDU9_9AGAR|nr:hypothetical protein B0H16DRAFT_1802266 [Mycena metata]
MPKHTRNSQLEDSEQFWPVEYIVSARRTNESLPAGCNNLLSRRFGSGWVYRVKWLNFSDSDNTWEPLENLVRCADEVQDFWEEVGLDTMLTNVEDFEKRGVAPKIEIPTLPSSSSQLLEPLTWCEIPQPCPSTPTSGFPNSPLSPPLTPEHEAASIQSMPDKDNSPQTPTFAPNDEYSSPASRDYLNTLLSSANDGLDVEDVSVDDIFPSQSVDLTFADYLLAMSPEEILNFGGE